MSELLSAASAASVVRAVKAWLNTCPEIPEGMSVTFEALKANDVSLCFSTEQAALYAARYIGGGYRAEYRFRIIYRVLPSDDDDQMEAVETLTAICAWCETASPPELEDAVNEKITRTSDAAVLTVYEDDVTDYGASLTLTWEVF